LQKLQPFIDSLQGFAQKQLNFDRPPKLLLKQDEENSKDVFGQTAFYDPAEESITIFIASRHPKDILRSLAHELVHHTQNLRGDLSPEKCGNMDPGYAQDNDHMRNMEREAYELGNLCFRDWEDGCKKQMQENKNLKENKKMTVKISRKDLKGIITKLLSERKIEEEVGDASKTAPWWWRHHQSRSDGDASLTWPQEEKLRAAKFYQDYRRNFMIPTGEGENTVTDEEAFHEYQTTGLIDQHGRLTPMGRKTVQAAQRAHREKTVPLAGDQQAVQGPSSHVATWPAPEAPAGLSQDIENLNKKELIQGKIFRKKLAGRKIKNVAQLNMELGVPGTEYTQDTLDAITARQEDWKKKGFYTGKIDGLWGGGMRRAAIAASGKGGGYRAKHSLAGLESDRGMTQRSFGNSSVADTPMRESKFQTPESEKALNESIFGKKNNEIFNRLKELWAK